MFDFGYTSDHRDMGNITGLQEQSLPGVTEYLIYQIFLKKAHFVDGY
jgi:hypothetical protein